MDCCSGVLRWLLEHSEWLLEHFVLLWWVVARAVLDGY